MGVGRFLVAAATSALLAAPVLAQTSSPSPATNRPAATTPSTIAPNTTNQPHATPSSQEQGGLVDINSASAQELDKLPGVGPARSQAIIANRPYKGKDDLTQRKILPQNVYNQIKDKIVARQGSTGESTGSAGSAPGTIKTK